MGGRKDSRDVLLNLPNTLTLFRFFCIPLVAACLNFQGRLGSFLSALFFGLAFVTDFLDGYFARKHGNVTALGKFLDPLADKILVSATMILLIPLDRIPAWVVMLIVGRELAVTGLRSIAAKEGTVIQASSLGKYKTIFQSVATIGLCLHYEYFHVDFHLIGMVFLWAALGLTLWSGWEYFLRFREVFFHGD
ncbi:MAG: CDP-diacylglycerol--glycerol-3-phosphate 3-phosphatidyltransferase [Deltaproteobacteria bacterium]|nr:CDP-diacylglycerol--glycerol-3-phosphate 3-phosphatidyltransferase [Deltaproteobacteria bacterium]MBW2016218.1 CDP-diacylglycerol--glycerol-3-phosphate 3-phosphatidyltransferase [Deltaproteobacteria bacterium]MBW2129078.1 CDP-diacylglycerol--glycerol-3-phosphate 3-phosphatidyltransferase [Deltaproteobacteria bacterium]MBW2302665.1 CDP-diacylglycerol--glycerol-3-phosphate 3-phosphatidyltransferase [Deltaproteobacteria bacterium]